MHTILALDPGKTTGYCIGLFDHRANILFMAPGEQRLSHRQFYEFVQRLCSECNWHNVEVVCETFTFRQGAVTGLDFTPAELIGILKWFCEGRTLINMHWQQPTVQGKKAYFSDDELKRLEIYWAHGKGHARSATKHFMNFVQFKGGIPIVGKAPLLKMVEERWLLDVYYHGVELY